MKTVRRSPIASRTGGFIFSLVVLLTFCFCSVDGCGRYPVCKTFLATEVILCLFIMDLRNSSREFIIEFIDCLRDCPSLWQTMSKEYKNKNSKLSAYLKLLEILQKYEPGSTIDHVKKKLQSLRASHRKERKKVTVSMRTGSGVDDVYHPKLWYYGELEFLNDQVECLSSMSTLDYCVVESYDSDNLEVTQNSKVINQPCLSPTTPDTNTTPEPPSFSRKRKDDTSNQILNLISKRLSQNEDEFDVIGKNVAAKLRSMKNNQNIFAEKLIHDVLFHGQMEQLSPESKIKLFEPLTSPHNTVINIPRNGLKPSTAAKPIIISKSTPLKCFVAKQ